MPRPLAAILAFALALPAAAGVSPLARRFAPVVIQEVRGRGDLLASVDYDGNWIARDNWENLEKFPQKATVYVSQIESSTHAYLLYVFFHPRDWWRINVMRRNRENDLDGALVVVDKALEPRVVVVEATGTGRLARFASDPGLAADGVAGTVRLEGERPILKLRAFDHAAAAFQGRRLAAEPGVVYRYRGVAEVPGGGNERDVGYELVDLAGTLWARRNDTGRGRLFGAVARFPGGTYGARLDADNWRNDGPDAPWMWGLDAGSGLARGVWFMDPARALRVRFPHQADRFPSDYVVHPYQAR